MTDPHPDDDLLLALALDDVDDTEREATLRHLSTCHRCRSDYDALAAAVEQSLSAAPNVEPSAGFDFKVLTAMGLDTAAGRPRRSKQSRQPRWQLVAASVVVGLGLGAGATAALSQFNDSTTVTLARDSAYLETGDGRRVGTVTRSFTDGEPVFVITITTGSVGMEYQCLLRLEGGGEVSPASWTLESDEGETWVVPTPQAPVTAVALVANGGAGPVWSEALL